MAGRGKSTEAIDKSSSLKESYDEIESATDSQNALGTLNSELGNSRPPPEEPKPRDVKDRAGRASEDLRRAAGNVITQVTSRVTTRGWEEPPPPPDGGAKAWTQVATGWLTVFTTWGLVNSFGSFQTYYTSTMPLPPSTISWIGSIQIWCTLIVSVFSGRLLDAGLFLPTFIAGAVIQLLGMFLMSISTQYWQLMLTQGILTGTGGGIMYTPAMGLVTTYFQKRRALAIGLVTTGNAAGGVIYPVVVRDLIPKVGFAWTARVLAFVNLGALSLALAFMRPRLPPRKSGPVVDWTAFKEPVFVSFVGGMFAFMWGNYYTFYYIASFGRDVLGLDYSSASIMLIILNGVAIPLRAFIPFIADRYGPLDVLLPTTLAWAIITFAWLAVKDLKGYYVFTCFYGMAAGGFQCLLPTVLSITTKRLDMSGTRLGMGFSIASFSALTGPPIGGAIQTATGNYTSAQVWAGCMTFAGFVLCVVARVKLAGWGLRARL